MVRNHVIIIITSLIRFRLCHHRHPIMHSHRLTHRANSVSRRSLDAAFVHDVEVQSFLFVPIAMASRVFLAQTAMDRAVGDRPF